MLDLHIDQLGGAYFRFFDPRVMYHLPRVLDAPQLSLLLQGIQQWVFVDWLGAYQAIQAPSVPATTPRLLVSPQQWQALGDIEAFNRLLSKQRRRQQPPSHAQVPLWLNHLQSARLRGLRQPDDIAHWAALCLAHGEPWQTHPQLNDVLQLVIHDGIPLKDALDDLLNLSLDPAEAAVPTLDD